MSDLASKLPSVDQPMHHPKPNFGYPNFGIPEMPSSMWYLRCTWLQNTLDTVSDGIQFAHFAKHALGLAKAWFRKLVAAGIDQARYPAGQFSLNPLPYFNMFGESPTQLCSRLCCRPIHIAKSDLMLLQLVTPDFAKAGRHLLTRS